MIVPQGEKTQSSNSSYTLQSSSEPKAIVPGMMASKLQMALSDRLLPTGKTIKPLKAEREVKNPIRFGNYFTHSSVINEEKEHLSYVVQTSFEIK